MVKRQLVAQRSPIAMPLTVVTTYSEMLRSSGGPRRRAYVVSTQEQAKFIEGLKSTAPSNLQVKAFYDERAAVAWLFPTAQRFPLTFLS
jgi:hypothetical protein